MNEFLTEYGVMIFYAILTYLAVISLVSSIVVIVDKTRSKIAGKRRVPEKTLMKLGALGGASAMLLTMLTIRHKTRHSKFMIGLPILILFHAVLLLFICQHL